MNTSESNRVMGRTAEQLAELTRNAAEWGQKNWPTMPPLPVPADVGMRGTLDKFPWE